MLHAEPRLHRRLRRFLKEPVNSLSHFLGVLLSLAGGAVLISASVPDAWKTISFTIYALSAMLLFSASTLLHAIRAGPRAEHALRRLDHAAIYLYIAGCYTPLTLVVLRPEQPLQAWLLLVGIWTLALTGTAFKVFRFGAPRWLSTTLYVLLGWAAVVALGPLHATLGAGGLFWLFAGGLFYTVGAVIYARKKPDPRPGIFGFHELWHLFVLAGSACHYLLMLLHVLPHAPGGAG